MRKEYTRLLIAVNDAKANVKEAVWPYHRPDRPENRLKEKNSPPHEIANLKSTLPLLGSH